MNGETIEPAVIEVVPRTELDAGTVTIPRGNRRHLVLSAPFALASGDTLRISIHRAEEYTEGAVPWAVGDISGDGIATALFERVSFKSQHPGGKRIFYYDLSNIIYSFNAP